MISGSPDWVRDVTYREDASRARTGNAPAVLAAIRNAVTTALRLAGALHIAVARRAATGPPHRHQAHHTTTEAGETADVTGP
jgi:hypothetical protein